MVSREKDSHKGENGKVAVIGGSRDYTGAPALSAQAALRAGCDLAKIVTSEEVSGTVASYSENLIVGEYPSGCLETSGVENAVDTIEWSDAVVIGPGLGEPDESAVKEVIEKVDAPLIIDADAMEPALETSVSGAVLTPHRGEKKLIEERYNSIESFVEETGNVVLVKGAEDRIYSENGVERVSAGHPGMTVGGTGDVLAGITASLISQGLDPEKAAVKAAEINGRAGEKAAEEYGNGLLATDLLEEIPGQF
jgi:ADP-dependent NAD(P)H-hydrate dehydratase